MSDLTKILLLGGVITYIVIQIEIFVETYKMKKTIKKIQKIKSP